MGQIVIEPSTMPAIVHAIGGSLGSAAALLLLYPLERAKIELQFMAGQQEQQQQQEGTLHQSLQLQQSTEIKSDKTVSLSLREDSMTKGAWNYVTTEEEHDQISDSQASPQVSKPQPEGDLWQCLNELRLKNELYRGVGPIVSTLATSNFFFFYINQWMKQFFCKTDATATNYNARLLLSLFCAGTCNVLLTNPLWVANLRIMTSRSSNNNTQLWHEIKHIYSTEGWRPLWAGTGSSILLVSNPVIQFFLYEHLRLQSHQSPFRAFWNGALSKAIATVLTYPLQLTQAVMRLHPHKYNSVVDCLLRLYQRDGLPGWYVGMRAKTVQSVLTAAVTFLTYEQIVGAVQAAHSSLGNARLRVTQ